MSFFRQPPVVRGDYANHYIYGHWLYMFGFAVVYLLAWLTFGGHPLTGVYIVAVGAGLLTTIVFAALREATRPNASYKDLLITIGGGCEAALLIHVGTIVLT